MKRLITFLTILLGFPLLAQAQTATVTGSARFPSGGNPTRASVCFTLDGYKPNQPRVIGSYVLINNTNWCINADSNGDYSSTITRNDFIDPSGTTWLVDHKYNGLLQSRARYNIASSTFDLDSAVSIDSAPAAATTSVIAQGYVHTQASAATTWTISHNFNNQNAVCLFFDASNQLIWPDTFVLTSSTVATATFVVAQAGRASCIVAGSFSLISSSLAGAVLTTPTSDQVIAGNFKLTVEDFAISSELASNITFTNDANKIIGFTAGGSTGRQVTLLGHAPASGVTGGVVSLIGGVGTSAAGGGLNLTAGAGTSGGNAGLTGGTGSAGTGGTVNITSGGGSSNNNAGDITLSTANGSGTGDGGDIFLTTGTGSPVGEVKVNGAGGLRLNNNIFVGSKSSGGTDMNLIGMNASNQVDVGDSAFDVVNLRTSQIANSRVQVLGALRFAAELTFTDADTTPSIAGRNIFVEANTGATSITTFDDGQPGQIIHIRFTTANTTLVDGATLQLAGSANFVGSADDVITLWFGGDNIWREVSRSVN